MRTQSSSIRALSVALFLAASMVFQTVPLMGATRIAPPGSVLNGRAGRNVASAPQPQPAAPEVKANGSRTSFESFVSKDDRPLIPLAPTITATLTDNVSLATKIAPGAIVNYVATITNSGASPANDATNLTYNATLDANTTLVPGSIHASPVAFNDTYNWIGNTVLDTNARSLPAVSANDVAVNATGGGDTFNVTPIAGGATTLGGTVTLLASGHYTYTPPLNRPTAIDGASVNDSFTYTITNSVDPALTSTGTVTITLTGRVFYLQQGATGDGRSANPSGNPGTMSTNADKPTDIFYIFSSGSSLVGLFTVDAGQQLLGSGVNLVVNIPTLGAVTLFTGTAPTPAINNGVGNCVTLAGAPGNNTLSGFNISTCNGFGIQGANVGTLAISTLSINNTIGGGLDLTGVGAPSVNIVLGGLTSTGGAKNVNLVGLNGTINLAGGALSSATGNGFDVNGGTAAITYTGSISNSGGKQVSVANKTGGSASFSGAISGTGTGINLTTNTGATIGFSGGMTLSTSTNAAFTATGGGTVNVSGTNNITTTSGAGINWNGDTSGSTVTFNNVTSTTGGAVSITSSGATDFTFNDVTATTGTAVGVTTATGDFIFHAVNANGAAKGIAVSSATGTFTVNGTATTDASGGTIQNCTAKGAEFISSNNITLKNMDFTNNGTAQTVAGSASTCGADLVGGNNLQCVSQVHLQTVTTVSLSNLNVTGGDQMGINGNAVSGFSLANSNVTGNGNESFENGLTFQNLTGTCSITDTIIRDNFAYQLNVTNIANSSTLTLGITGTRTNNAYPTQDTSTTMIGRTAVPV
ncbi:MAG TPA: hypothetical protein VGO68_18460, partial [Pyrinomonadaceae bacterium]|nr:hypothetical protein [Pyrinomonadaceae bacterium]